MRGNVARRHGISISDLHLLGALRLDRSKQPRATDLALRDAPAPDLEAESARILVSGLNQH
jgi:hypothetical protein